jgi:hypothetical protein
MWRTLKMKLLIVIALIVIVVFIGNTQTETKTQPKTILQSHAIEKVGESPGYDIYAREIQWRGQKYLLIEYYSTAFGNDTKGKAFRVFQIRDDK